MMKNANTAGEQACHRFELRQLSALSNFEHMYVSIGAHSALDSANAACKCV